MLRLMMLAFAAVNPVYISHVWDRYAKQIDVFHVASLCLLYAAAQEHMSL
jgi:hypothetical protein